jgi:hypothetical protein
MTKLLLKPLREPYPARENLTATEAIPFEILPTQILAQIPRLTLHVIHLTHLRPVTGIILQRPVLNHLLRDMSPKICYVQVNPIPVLHKVTECSAADSGGSQFAPFMSWFKILLNTSGRLLLATRRVWRTIPGIPCQFGLLQSGIMSLEYSEHMTSSDPSQQSKLHDAQNF